MGQISDALGRAVRGAWTRPMPKSAGAQMRFLMRREKGSTAAVAARLGVTQRTVQRYLKGDRTPSGAAAAALARETARDWQPRVTAKAKKQAEARGIRTETRARFGFTSAAGSTDDGRMRRITQTLPPHLVGEMWRAYEAGDEARLQELVGDGLGEVYFRDGGQRAHGLDVELTDVDYIDMDLE